MDSSLKLSPLAGVEADLDFEILDHAASPGCTWTAAAARKGQLAFLNLDTGQSNKVDSEDAWNTWAATVSESGETALTVCDRDRYSGRNWDHHFLYIWDVAGLQVVERFDFHDGCYVISATPNLERAAAFARGRIHWSKPLSDKTLGSVDSPHTQSVWKLALSRNGDLSASASPQEAIIWDVSSRKAVATIKLPKKNIFSKKRMIGSLHFTSKHVYYGSNHGQLWRTDLSGEHLELIADTGHKLWVAAIDIHEPSNTAALVIWGGRLELWDLNTSTLITTQDTEHTEAVKDVRVKADLSRVVTTGKDGCARAWSISGKTS